MRRAGGARSHGPCKSIVEPLNHPALRKVRLIRHSPILHSLQRTKPVAPWLPALAHGWSRTNKADSGDLTEWIGPKQM